MNIYVSDEIKQKWPQYEFIGKPIKLRDGKTYMRATFKFDGHTHFYVFEDDWFWWDSPIEYLQKQSPHPQLHHHYEN